MMNFLLFQVLVACASLVADFDVGTNVNLAISPLLGAALIGGASSLISGLFGASSQRSANEQNAQIARENRDWQSDENVLNRQWSEKMWEKENLYNTPSAMRERLEVAGYNPNALFDASSSLRGGNVSSPSMVGSPNMPEMRPVNFGQGLEGLGNSVSLGLQASAVDANNANQRSQQIKNVLDAAREAYKIGGVSAAQNLLDLYLPVGSDVKTSPYVQQFVVEQKQREYEFEMFDFRSQIEQRFGYQKAERALELLQYETDEILSKIDKMKSDIEVNDASVNELLTRSAKNIAERANLNADTTTINAMRSALVDSLELKADMDFYEEREKNAEFENRSHVRLYKKSAYAQKRRLETEDVMNPKYNKRAARLHRFRQILYSNAPME